MRNYLLSLIAEQLTKKLMDKLGYKINELSKLTIVTANGSQIRSLGKINWVPLELEDKFIPITFQVLDSVDDTLILGNDWLQKVQAVLNWKKGTLTIHGANAPLTTQSGILEKIKNHQTVAKTPLVMNMKVRMISKKPLSITLKLPLAHRRS